MNRQTAQKLRKVSLLSLLWKLRHERLIVITSAMVCVYLRPGLSLCLRTSVALPVYRRLVTGRDQ